MDLWGHPFFFTIFPTKFVMGKNKIVVLTGAGVSAESGLGTYRDNGGLWDNFDPMEVASIQGWRANPAKVLDFYNMQREKLSTVCPNDAHKAIAALEERFDVTVITQNVDDLHERAGSSHIIHLHGEATKVRPDHGVYDGTGSEAEVVSVGYSKVRIGDKSASGVQLRPHIVFFGEDVPKMTEAVAEVSDAGIMIIIGTSMTVYPAASLYLYAPQSCKIYLIDPRGVPVEDARIVQIRATASDGMRQLFSILE